MLNFGANRLADPSGVYPELALTFEINLDPTFEKTKSGSDQTPGSGCNPVITVFCAQAVTAMEDALAVSQQELSETSGQVETNNNQRCVILCVQEVVTHFI